MRAPDHYLDLLVPPASDGLAGHQAELQMVNGVHNAIGGPLARALAETYTTYIASLHLPFSAAPNLGVWSQWDPQVHTSSLPALALNLPSPFYDLVFGTKLMDAGCAGAVGEPTHSGVRSAQYPGSDHCWQHCGALRVLERAHGLAVR
jgi:hypothetical protein